MRKKPAEEIITKSHKRAQKKRPRMKIHGRSLKSPSASHAGQKLASSSLSKRRA